MKPKCVVCHRVITYQFWLCSKCEDKYGNRMGDWPPWLQFLVKDTRRERYRNQRDASKEEPLESLEDTGYHLDDHDKDRHF